MGTFGANFGEHFDGPVLYGDKTPASRAINVEIGASISAGVRANERAKIDDPALVVAMSPNSADFFVSKADFEARINSLGQKTKAASTPVTLASDQNALAIYVDAPAMGDTGIVSGMIILGGGTANTIQEVKATVYTPQSTNAIRSLKSSSASDTSAGTGARSVRITYFDQLMYGPYVEDIILNGVTAVQTLNTNICFIESLVVLSVGSAGANVGTISLYSDSLGLGTVIGTIGIGNIAAGIGDNRTFWAHHYVPVGKITTLSTYIVAAISGGSGTAATFFLNSQNPLLTTSNKIVISDLLITISTTVRQLSYPIKVLGPAYINASGVPGINNATLSAAFDFLEQDVS